MSTLLVLSIFVPFVAALALALLPMRAGIAKALAVLTSLVTLGLSIAVTVGYLQADVGSGLFAEANRAWLPESLGVDVRFHVALDGISLWLYALSALLVVTAVLVSWSAIQDRPHLFYAMLLLLESGCLGVFSARDVILFYVFFEFTLIPLFFLIGIWGSEDRRYAAVKFFLFTLVGSLFTFLGLLAVVLWSHQHGDGSRLSFSMAEVTRCLVAHPLPTSYQVWIFVALFAGFAIKVPLFPLHTWLPLAHVQAPTAGSVLLAGILLKMGTYGFVRFSIPLVADRHGGLHAVDAVVVRGRDRLWCARGAGAIGYQAIDRVLQRESPRILHARPIRPQSAGNARSRPPDGQPWNFDGRALCHRRYVVRTVPHP